MIFKPFDIPVYNLEEDSWTTRRMSTGTEYLEYLNSMWKLPGEYNLVHTDLWRQHALKFQKDRHYCGLQPNTIDYKEWWAREKKKNSTGVIYQCEGREFYVTGDYNWFLNWTPIVDKLKKSEDFADVWDGHYHMSLYVERARMMGLNVVITKARQKGVSIYFTSILTKSLWFKRLSVNKMLAYEDDFINDKGSWKFFVGYRNHLNEHTPWYRNFEPDEMQHWEQKQTVTEGVVARKKKFKGLRSKLMAGTTKKNPAKAVGGGTDELLCEESGISPNLGKVLEYADAATKMGGIKTGNIYVIGAVGELKDCKPLEDISFSPRDHGFLGVEDTFSDNPQGEIGFFFPDEWNYIALVDNQPYRCYDDNGNSDMALAKKYLALDEVEQRKKGEEKYRLWKSQHPSSLQDAFAVRETNDFPVELIQEQKIKLVSNYKPLTIELFKEKDKYKHRYIEGFPVKTLKVDPLKDNSGCIEVDELPIDNPPWGLYYAGVDPIAAKNTSTSKSLQSVTIYKAVHYVGDKLIMDYPVARYTGRHPRWEDTYRVSLELIKFYNCRTAVENNITDFIEWMIKQAESKWLMRRREISMVNEFVPGSTIRDEIGIRMEGELKKKALDFLKTYLDEIIGTEFDQEGNAYYIYGVSRIKDLMLLEELLRFTPKLNTDRCFPKDTLILTSTGYKEIQSIEIGEEVISHDSTRNKVFQKHINSYEGDVYSFRVVGQFNELICTEEHPILVGRYTKKPTGGLWRKRRENLDVQQYLPAKEIRKGDKVFIPKRQLVDDSTLTPEFLYLAGWVFGDGYLNSKQKAQIRISLGINEEHLAKQLVDLLNKHFPNTEGHHFQVERKGVKYFYNRETSSIKAFYKKNKYKKSFDVYYSNRQLADLLRYHTGTPNNKHISQEIFDNSSNLYFIAGCFASDGHLRNGKSYDGGCKKYCLEFASVYKKATYQIRQMLLDNGIWNTIRLCSYYSKKLNHQDQYKIEIQDEISINKIGSIFNIYPPVSYERSRKIQFYIETKQGYWVSVKEIKKEYKELEVYNVAVENTNTYVAENFAVHNCVSFIMALLAARSNTNRNIIVDAKPYNHTPEKKKKLIVPNQFQNPVRSNLTTKLPSQFRKR